MSRAKRYSPEVRERVVRMVLESEGDYPSQWQAIQSIAAKIECSPDSLRAWLKRTQIGGADGTRTRDPRRDRPVF